MTDCNEYYSVWRTFHIVAVSTVVFAVVLGINATNFDATELESLAEFAAVVGGWFLWWDKRQEKRKAARKKRLANRLR